MGACVRQARRLHPGRTGRPALALAALALVALALVAILLGVLLIDLPVGAMRQAVLAGLGLVGLATMALLVPVLARLPATSELDRFEALSDRLERGIERLKDLQWELSDNEARYRDLLDSQNDVITRVDTQGRLTYVNRAFCRTFGVEAGAVLGTAFQPEVLRQDAGQREPPEPGRRQRFEELVMTAEGARWFAFEQHAITAETGEIREIQRLGRDVTEQRRIQSALAEARDQAEAANRAKSRFLAAMSHEIRTPMNGILGMTDLLADTALSPEQTTYVEAIDHSAKNLLNIIDEILDLSKIEAGKLEVHTAPFPFDQCLQSVIELMAPRAREKGLDLAWWLEPELPRIVVGDETRVRQIVLNLIGNAIKFTDSGGVAVRARRFVPSPVVAERGTGPRPLGLEIEVTDTGSGIAEHQMHTLFAEFEQADDVVRRKRSGTGLGLAISRRLARVMDGDIEVSSEPGRGSTFVARIVVNAEAASRPALELPANRLACRVLLVSSRIQQRMLMQETLRSLGIASAISPPHLAADALARAHREGQPIDTLVSDAEAGAEAIGELIAIARRLGHSARTILVVDLPGVGRLDAFRSVGCDAYLVRPVRPTSLVTQLGLTIPRAAASQGEAPVPARPRKAPGRARRILIVEDNEINALLARRMSEKAGCVVAHAPSGPAALAHCEELLGGEEMIDLVLMDIHMPEMDGFETARRVRHLFEARGRLAPPIVALTANAFAEDRKRCLEAGLDDYLAKPFDRSELEALLDKWCGTERTPRDGSLEVA